MNAGFLNIENLTKKIETIVEIIKKQALFE